MNKLSGFFLAAALAFSMLGCSTAIPKPDSTPTQRSVETTLVEFTETYAARDLEGFYGTFAEGAMFDTSKVADRKDAWYDYFQVMAAREEDQRMVLRNVTISEDRASAWMTEYGDEEFPCAGPALFLFNDAGEIEELHTQCVHSPEAVAAYALSESPVVDQALAGQAADVASTVVGLANGMVEGNPIVAGVGLPVAGAIKIGLSQHAETLLPRSCYTLKMALATSGWGASGWNACSLLIVGSAGMALPLCAGAAIIAGTVAYEAAEVPSLLACQPKFEGVRYEQIGAGK